MHDYVVDFITGGVYMLLHRWTEEGMKTPAEQMGRLAYQLVAHTGALGREQPKKSGVPVTDKPIAYADSTPF